MKNTSKKLILIMALAVALICTAVGSTVAYLFDRTPPIENSFEPVYISCAVEEKFDGITKSEVKVRNTGDINAYVRATYVVMWTADDGSVLGTMPKADVDYTVILGSPRWQKGTDGFYYYSSQVAADSSTEVFLDSISVIGTAPSGYKLSVHVAATAIQADPGGVVEESWGAVVQPNGTIVAP